MKLFSLCLLVSLLFIEGSKESYQPITCEGEIPDLFVNGMDNYINVQEDAYKNEYKNDEDLEKLKENLILGSALNHSFYFRNGIILFGDPITNYLNEIKSEILKNRKDLQGKINVFTLKTSEVNAYSTMDGNVYVTLGLLARMNSESELAFVLSHEISHFVLKHTIESLKVKTELEDLTKKRKNLTMDDMLRLKFQRSREHEFEADSLGYILFNESPYKNESALDVLTCLATAHQPVGNIPFEKNYFNQEYFCIPTCFFIDNVKEVEALENKDDIYQTHPDIIRRKTKIHEKLTLSGKHGQSFILNKQDFDKIKNIACFEVLQRLVANRNYGDAIYTSFYLLKQNPGNEYLSIVLVKALYAASVYKNNQSYHYTSSSYSKVQGESQQVHYLLKNLTASQLNSIALGFIYKMKNKFPNHPDLDLMETKLIEDLVMIHNLNLDSYNDKNKSQEQYASKYGKPISDTSSTKIKLRQDYKSFFLSGLYELKDDQSIQNKFKQALEKKKKLDDFEAMPFKEKEKINEAKKIQKEKNGLQIKADNILILEPEYFRYQKDIKESIQESQNEKKELIDELNVQLKALNKNIKMVYVSNLSKQQTELFNDYSLLAGWLRERENHLSKIQVIPVIGEQIRNNKNFSNYKYCCSIDIVKYRNNYCTYIFRLYNLETGERIYYNFKHVNENMRINKLITSIIDDFQLTIY